MLNELLALPDGLEVVVAVESLPATVQVTEPVQGASFADLPCFGMWRDREDMADAEMWVRRQRDQWALRVSRQD